MRQATNVDTLGTVSDVAERVGGELVGTRDLGTRSVTRVDIDSRTCTRGTLFVPLPGTRTDGHRFIGDAFAHGAEASFVRRSRRADGSRDGAPPHDAAGPPTSVPHELSGARDRPLILVDDPLAALQRLAAARRRELQGVCWVGITGSNGKTTTKALIAAVLSARYGERRVFRSKGNYNSEIGLPLSVLEVTPAHHVAVLELAMNNPGEMAVLAETALPQVALITNIGDAHIGHLGSRDAIAAEKRCIYSRLRPEDTALVPEDEPYRDFLTRDVPARIVPFGETTTAGYEGARATVRGWELRWRGRSISLRLPGRHNLLNALAAISASLEIGVDDDAVARGLEAATPVAGRTERIDGRVTVINDAYNANPDSMKAAFDTFEGMEVSGRRIVVIGEMGELGDYAAAAHRRVLDDARGRGFDLVVAVGPAYQYGAGDRVRPAASLGEARELVAGMVEAGDAVLLKGSRAAALERLIPYILDAVEQGE
ncbi:MAG: UDP-N-acetylmuramoyl-tripeptide--D-alanyl-D-alanine ligase [Spirochaetota bacterium]